MIDEHTELFLKGILPKHWKETTRPWKTKLIRKIWEISKATWLKRCKFAATAQDRLTDTVIENLYNEQDKMSTSNASNIYQVPLQELLQKSSKDKWNWVNSLQKTIKTAIQQAATTMSTTNYKITNFFLRPG